MNEACNGVGDDSSVSVADEQARVHRVFVELEDLLDVAEESEGLMAQNLRHFLVALLDAANVVVDALPQRLDVRKLLLQQLVDDSVEFRSQFDRRVAHGALNATEARSRLRRLRRFMVVGLRSSRDLLLKPPIRLCAVGLGFLLKNL